MSMTNQDPPSLYPPQLPQMAADSVINAADLASDGGVLIVVNEPQNAAQGDYLTLYWNGSLIDTQYINTSTPSDFYPWETTINSAVIPDGSYQAYYTRVDEAANITTSLVATAIVQRDNTGSLPAPDFPEADNRNTITADDISDGSTLVHIPTYSGMSTGDEVNIYWVGFDGSGKSIPLSVTSVQHIIAAEDTTLGFTVPIAAPFVSVIGTGTASAWYSVLPYNGGNASSSDTASVLINIAQTTLPPPYFPEGSDGWIDANEAIDGTPVAVLAYPGITTGDTVTIRWQGYAGGVPVNSSKGSSQPHSVSSSEVSTGFQVTLPYTNIQPIGIGTMQAWYEVNFFGSTDEGLSTVAQVNVDTTHYNPLPPPVFPAAAGDNTITTDEVTADSGTAMNITYPGMAAGDTVTVFWFGYQTSSANPVGNTQWTTSRTVTLSEAQSSLASFLVPENKITPAMDGYGEGKYQVFYNGQQGMATSVTTDVQLVSSSVSMLSMNCSTGAPIFDPTVLVRPLNSVSLSGPPGADVELSLSAGSDAWFNPEGVQTLRLRLDSNGRGSTMVYAFSTGNVLVSAFIVTDPSLNTSDNMTFTNWLPGSGEMSVYGISTGAVADGLSPCSVYLQTAPGSTAGQALLTLTGVTNAIIPISGTTRAFVDVSTTHAAGFNVTDTVSEPVSFTLSLPDTGSYITSALSFLPPLLQDN